MKIRVLLTVLPLTAIGVSIPATAFAAAPVAASCGAVLTTDAYLSADLTCPAGTGLTVSGNVTIDLRHHQLAAQGRTGTAITVSNPSSPTVKNGRISGWDTGLTYLVADDEPPATVGTATIDNVTFSNNNIGIASGGGIPLGLNPNYIVRNSQFRNNTAGISGVFTGSTDVAGSTFSGNGTGAKVDTGQLLVNRSQFNGNGTGIFCEEAGCSLKFSHLSNNQTAITSRTFGITATANVITGSTIGLDAFGSTDNHLNYNVFSRNVTGINLVASGGTLAQNVFTLNHVGFTSSNGTQDDPAELDQNVLTRNGDAIYVEDQGVRLQGNIANRNTGWGIYAPQSTDLGGNRAAGNGNTPQCVGVAC